MHALVTGTAATLPLILIAFMVMGIISEHPRTRVINWLAAIPVFCLTIIMANIYASQHGGGGMWWWYGILTFMTVFVILPCAADDTPNPPSNS